MAGPRDADFEAGCYSVRTILIETHEHGETLRDQALGKVGLEFQRSLMAHAVGCLRMGCGPSTGRPCGDVPMAAFSVITYGRIWGDH